MVSSAGAGRPGVNDVSVDGREAMMKRIIKYTKDSISSQRRG